MRKDEFLHKQFCNKQPKNKRKSKEKTPKRMKEKKQNLQNLNSGVFVAIFLPYFLCRVRQRDAAYAILLTDGKNFECHATYRKISISANLK